MSDHDTAAVLTEAEREELHGHVVGCESGEVWATVERILGARLAAQPPQDDPQPDEREALARALKGHGKSFASPYNSGVIRCACSMHFQGTHAHAQHQADAVLAAGFRRDPDAGLREARAALDRVLAACDLAEAEARHVVDDESMVATGVIRWAARPMFAADADVTVYWPDVRPTYDRAALAEPTPGSES